MVVLAVGRQMNTEVGCRRLPHFGDARIRTASLLNIP